MKKQRNNKTTTKVELERVEKALRTELLRFEERLDRKFVTKFDLQEAEERIDENAKQYRDQLLTKLDGVMGELQTRREEDAVGTYQISELREHVDDHEKRITFLEKV